MKVILIKILIQVIPAIIRRVWRSTRKKKVRLWILFGTAAATAVSAIFAPEKLTAMMNLLRELLANEP